MESEQSAVNFFSKCWIPLIYPGKSRFYYAYGNTTMQDLLADLKVSTTTDILLLGSGDIRHALKTIAGLATRPKSAGKPAELRFHLNDCDCEVIARDIVLMEIIDSIDAENLKEIEYLWDIWYNMTILQSNYARLICVLERLVSGSFSQTWSFGDSATKKQVIQCWQCWLKESVVDRQKIELTRLSYMKVKNFDLTKNFSLGPNFYTDTFELELSARTKKFGEEFHDTFRSGIARDFNSTQEADLVNPTMMRPGSDLWHVHYGSNPFWCYLPFEKKYLDSFTSLLRACMSTLQTVVTHYKTEQKKDKLNLVFWLADAFVFCHQLLPSKTKFDYIHCSNLPDHVSLMNLLVTCSPLLKDSSSVIATETFRIKSVESYLHGNLGCSPALFPTVFGLRLAREFDLGSEVPPSRTGTSYAYQTWATSFYWVKSLDEQTVPISFDESPDLRDFFEFATSRCFSFDMHGFQFHIDDGQYDVTPLTLIFIIKRLQHLFRDGLRVLLDVVDHHISKSGRASHAIAWKTLCSAFSLCKPDDDELVLVSMLIDCNFPSETDPELVGWAPLASICIVRREVLRILQQQPDIMSRMGIQSGKIQVEVVRNYAFDYDNRKFTIVLPRRIWNSLAPDDTFVLLTSPSRASLDQLVYKISCSKSNAVIQGRVCSSDIRETSDNDRECICCELNDRYEVQFKLDRKGERVKITSQFTGQHDRDLHKTRVELTITGVGSNCCQKRTVAWNFSCSLLPELCKFQVCSKQGYVKATLSKDMEFFNSGRTAMPYRTIDNAELFSFPELGEVEMFFRSTNVVNFMFTPAEIIMKQDAASRGVRVDQEPFNDLRETIALIMQDVYQKPKIRTMRFVYREDAHRLESHCSQMTLQMKGFYLYKSRPFVLTTIIDENKVRELVQQKMLDELQAFCKRCELIDSNFYKGTLPFNETCRTILVSKEGLRLTLKLLRANKLRVCQNKRREATEAEWYWNSYLQLLYHIEPWFMKSPTVSHEESSACFDENAIGLLPESYLQQFISQGSVNTTSNSSGDVRRDCQNLDWPQNQTKRTQIDQPAQLTPAQVKVDTAKKPFFGACSACQQVTDNLRKCAACHAVSYCSKTCQRADWSKHKAACDSMKNVKDTVTPAAERTESTPLLCCSCKRSTPTLKKCTGCSKVFYCNKECQKADWIAHKPICRH